MLGTAASSITIRAGIPGRIEAVKSGAESLFEIQVDHHIFGDLPALGGAILQAVQARLHFRDAALKPGGEGLDRRGRRE